MNLTIKQPAEDAEFNSHKFEIWRDETFLAYAMTEAALEWATIEIEEFLNARMP